MNEEHEPEPNLCLPVCAHWNVVSGVSVEETAESSDPVISGVLGSVQVQYSRDVLPLSLSHALFRALSTYLNDQIDHWCLSNGLNGTGVSAVSPERLSIRRVGV